MEYNRQILITYLQSLLDNNSMDGAALESFQVVNRGYSKISKSKIINVSIQPMLSESAAAYIIKLQIYFDTDWIIDNYFRRGDIDKFITQRRQSKWNLIKTY